MQYTIEHVRRLGSKRGVEEAISCLLSLPISDENKRALGDLYDKEGNLCPSAVKSLIYGPSFSFA